MLPIIRFIVLLIWKEVNKLYLFEILKISTFRVIKVLNSHYGESAV